MKYHTIDDRLGNDSGPFEAEEIEAFCRENGIVYIWRQDRSEMLSDDGSLLAVQAEY